MLEEMSQSLKRAFCNSPVDERLDFEGFRGIRSTEM